MNFMKKGIAAVFCIFSLTCIFINAQSQDERSTEKKPTVNTKQQTPTKIIAYIPGTWVVEHVFQGKKEITNADAFTGMKILEFNREGRYSSSSAESLDSGAYRVNEEHSVLYLASGTNETPTEWNVSFDKNGTMSLTSRNSGKKSESVTYVYRRESSTTSSNRE
jgi:hypothetical protein